MHNSRKGICTIIGNGVSLRKVSNDFLTQFPTFGTNRGYLKYTPDYYVCVNPLVIEQNKAEIESLRSVKFIRAGSGLSTYPLYKNADIDFSFEPLKYINEGYTVTYVCLQLAYWMGFNVVLLVGIDHHYDFTGKPNDVSTMQEDDPNHFDKSYFKGQKWQNPDLVNSEKYYKIANDIFKKDGRRIINLTEGTKLDIFEKGNISEYSSIDTDNS